MDGMLCVVVKAGARESARLLRSYAGVQLNSAVANVCMDCVCGWMVMGAVVVEAAW